MVALSFLTPCFGAPRPVDIIAFYLQLYGKEWTGLDCVCILGKGAVVRPIYYLSTGHSDRVTACAFQSHCDDELIQSFVRLCDTIRSGSSRNGVSQTTRTNTDELLRASCEVWLDETARSITRVITSLDVMEGVPSPRS